jgi:hypothetical protein
MMLLCNLPAKDEFGATDKQREVSSKKPGL